MRLVPLLFSQQQLQSAICSPSSPCMCSYLAETFLEEELEEERIAGDDDSVASCSDTEGSTAWLSKDLSMQSSDQEDTTVSDCTVEPPDYSKLDATIIVDSDISPPLNQSASWA